MHWCARRPKQRAWWGTYTKGIMHQPSINIETEKNEKNVWPSWNWLLLTATDIWRLLQRKKRPINGEQSDNIEKKWKENISKQLNILNMVEKICIRMKKNEKDRKRAIVKPQRKDWADSCKRCLKPTSLVISWPLEIWMSYAVAENPAFRHVLLTFCVAPKRSKQWWTFSVLAIMSPISCFNSGRWSSALNHLAANGEYKMHW